MYERASAHPQRLGVVAHRQPHNRAVHRQRAEPRRQHLVQPFKLGPKGSAYNLPGTTSRQHNTGIAQSRANLELSCTKLRLPEINRYPQYRAPLCVAALQKGRGENDRVRYARAAW